MSKARTLGLYAVALAMAALITSCAKAPSPPPKSGVERMYVFDCGENQTNDVSPWLPGTAAGTPGEFSIHCYLIRHAAGLMLWDAGLADSIAESPNGVTRGKGAIRSIVRKTLASQLAEIGVKPEEVTHIAFSHMHADHVGNANAFTRARLYIQETEHEAAFGPNASKFGFDPSNYDRLRSDIVLKLNGDYDVFGDGAVTIISTPGHTPGHQSLLVRLPKRGAVLLSGDVVHSADNWVNRRVPVYNFSPEQSRQSMEKITELVKVNKAQLWINHDKAQNAGIPKSPAFVE
jgi:glyoxylase-like metal-dependent hydrolase (beta-lactamase superfamily II)